MPHYSFKKTIGSWVYICNVDGNSRRHARARAFRQINKMNGKDIYNFGNDELIIRKEKVRDDKH
jgi:hypothetical protein